MKKITLGLLFFAIGSSAQNNIVASGGKATGSTGTATYTLGQIAYQTNNGSNGAISQGVQQAFEIVTLGIDDIPQIQLSATVYPNPTVQNVTLAIKEYDLTNLEYFLFDIQGRQITKGKITENETQIEMAALPSTQYFLKISNNNQDIKIFKIIKN